MSRHAPGFLAVVEDAKTRIRELRLVEMLRWRDEGRAFVLLDVREDREWEAGFIDGAEHLGKGVLERDVEARFEASTTLVLYCGGGYRSALAADMLQRMGYADVYSLAGGIRAWREHLASDA